VVPNDARDLVDRGVLDQRLFDVTGLIAAGQVAGRELGLRVTGEAANRVRELDGVRVTGVDDSGVAVRVADSGFPGLWKRLSAPGMSGTVVPEGLPPVSQVRSAVDTVEIRFLARDHGGADTKAAVYLYDLDRTGETIELKTGVATKIPKGNYLVWVACLDMNNPMVLTQARRLFDKDETVTADAKTAKPIDVTLPGTTPMTGQVSVSASMAPPGRQGFGAYMTGPESGKPVLIGSLVETTDEDSNLNTTINLERRPSSAPEDSYTLSWNFAGATPAGFKRVLTEYDLARIDVTRAKHGPDATTPGHTIQRSLIAIHPHSSGVMSSDPKKVGTARSVKANTGPTKHYVNTTPGLRWIIEERVFNGQKILHTASTDPIVPQAGRTYQQRWNTAVFGPAWNQESPFMPIPVTHNGKELHVKPTLFGDGQGRAGYGEVANARLVVERDGKVISDTGEEFAEVPVVPGAGKYKVSVDVARPAYMTLSTKVNATWTFDSAEGTADKPVVPGLWAIGYDPDLGDTNTAPAGKSTTIRVGPRLPGGADRVELTQLAIETSVDDGVSWRPAPVTQAPDGTRSIVVDGPATDGYVSLRATATDAVGASTQQTVIRAYQVKKTP
jgi:hypothetical protein